MTACKVAISVAIEENNWQPHPSRPKQKIAFVSDLGSYWESNNPSNDVDINGCVVWDTETDHYALFITTDTTKTAKQIIQTYELRPEIEEDYRQIKDFWKIENFRSKKLHTIIFHIICVLFGYLFFQLYTMLPEGEKYSHKSLPIIMKGYMSKVRPFLVVYSGEYFGIITLKEAFHIYAECDISTRLKLDEVLELL